MSVRIEQIATLAPDQIRAMLPGFVQSYFDGVNERATAATEGVRSVLDQATDDEIAQAQATYMAAGERGYVVYEASPLLRQVARTWQRRFMSHVTVDGVEHLAASRGRNQLWICNHLSYIDTQTTDILLAESGLDAVVDNMLVVAGPKVYEDPFRRLAAIGLNTLKTAQSSRIRHNAAELSARQIAEIAVRNLKSAQVWRAERGPVLLYPEGSRSRTGRLQPFLRAAARYARHAEVIVPVSLSGTDGLFGMDLKMRPSAVTLRIGEPFEPPKGKTAWLEQAWDRVADGLEPRHTPEPGTAKLG